MTPPGPNSSSPQAQASARFESSASLSDALSSPGDEALFASVNQLLLPRLQASPGTGGAGPDRVVDAASASLDDLIGCGPTEAISRLGHWFGTTAQDVRDPGFFAHMDPPTLWVSWVAHLWAGGDDVIVLHELPVCVTLSSGYSVNWPRYGGWPPGRSCPVPRWPH